MPVPREWSSRQAACVGYVSPLSVRQIYKSLSKPTSTPFAEPKQELNSSSSCCRFFFFTLLLAHWKKKEKTAAQVLSSRKAARGEQQGLIAAGDELDRHPAYLCSSRKISVFPISKLSRLFLQCWFLRGQQWGHIRSAVQVDQVPVFRRVCAPVA